MKHASPGLLLAAFLWALPPTPFASAADLIIDVTNVRSSRGHVALAVCDPERFGGPDCTLVGASEAREGTTRVIVRNVPPGRWAVEAFHDENDNQQFDTNFLGLPTEGFGFSNDPRLRGKPLFEESAIDVREPRTEITLRLRNSLFE
ncbi:DUF2141 domain-containing protein [Roseiterribacter gracilis]|uniref:DUF2141 domain-containing protein n=1 Tax=Roseiterribacter gracilis TaxID=2812848 RepID=A0A8S8XAS5_9PROT|nr:hypothetical protein TMPK1_20910 [Rhodospirillales bacterium TMPK1]